MGSAAILPKRKLPILDARLITPAAAVAFRLWRGVEILGACINVREEKQSCTAATRDAGIRQCILLWVTARANKQAGNLRLAIEAIYGSERNRSIILIARLNMALYAAVA